MKSACFTLIIVCQSVKSVYGHLHWPQPAALLAFVFLLCVKNLRADIFWRDLGAVSASSVTGGTSTARQAGSEGGIVEMVAGQVKKELYETAGSGEMAVG